MSASALPPRRLWPRILLQGLPSESGRGYYQDGLLGLKGPLSYVKLSGLSARPGMTIMTIGQGQVHLALALNIQVVCTRPVQGSCLLLGKRLADEVWAYRIHRRSTLPQHLRHKYVHVYVSVYVLMYMNVYHVYTHIQYIHTYTHKYTELCTYASS